MEKSNHNSAGPRRRKQAFLPQVTKLAQERRSSREISEEFGVGKSTINAIEVRMRDKHGPCRLPLVSNEELRGMSDRWKSVLPIPV